MAPPPTRVVVDSEERIALARPVVDRSEEGARLLGDRYWEELGRSTKGVVRAHRRADGVDVRLGPLVTLLRFGPREITSTDEETASRYPIAGGWLAARPGGMLAIVQRSLPSLEVAVRVEGYSARLGPEGPGRHLRGRLYAQVQLRAHRAVSRRFLDRAARGWP